MRKNPKKTGRLSTVKGENDTIRNISMKERTKKVVF